MPNDDLKQLAEKWESLVRRKFYDAKFEKDAMGKRLIEHGAVCYFNCAQELKEALLRHEQEPSTIPLEPQR